MAITQNPIIGRAKGQAGGMVFCQMNGKNIIKSKALNYNDKNSVAQQNVRVAKFKAGNELASKVKSMARVIFQVKPAGRNAYSAMSAKILTAFGGTVAAPTFTPTGVILGQGSLPIVYPEMAEVHSPGNIQVDWSPVITDLDETANDTFSCLVTKADGTNAAFIQTAVKRIAGTAIIALPAFLHDGDIFVSSCRFTSPSGLLMNQFDFAAETITMN